MEYSSLHETPFFKNLARLEAPFARTPPDVVVEALRLAEARPGELLIDLGSGDGVVLMVASRMGLRCIGYEVDERLYRLSRALVEAEGLEGLITIYNEDFMEADLSEADIVYAYLTPTVLGAVEEKVSSECREGARVVCFRYPLPNMEPLATRPTPYGPIYLYVPQALRLK